MGESGKGYWLTPGCCIKVWVVAEPSRGFGVRVGHGWCAEVPDNRKGLGQAAGKGQKAITTVLEPMLRCFQKDIAV